MCIILIILQKLIFIFNFEQYIESNKNNNK